MLMVSGIVSCVDNYDNPAPVVDDKPFNNDQYIDQSVRPGDDFFRYAYGKWLDDASQLSLMEIVMKKMMEQETQTVAQTDDPAVAALLQLATAAETDNSADVELVKSRLEYLTTIKTQEDLLTAFSQLHQLGYMPLVRQVYFGETRVIRPVITAGLPSLIIKQGIALPTAVPPIIKTICSHLDIIGLSQERIDEITQNATEIETMEIAAYESNYDMLKEKLRRAKIRPRTRAAVSSSYREVCKLLGVEDLADQLLIDTENEKTKALEKVIDLLLAGTEESVAKLRDYLIYYVMGQDMLFMPNILPKLNTEERVAYAIKHARYHWYRLMTEAYGKENIHKEKCQEMMENFRDILIERIGNLDWMSDATKQAAQKKAREMRFHIGYPDEWNEEFTPEVKGKTLLEAVTSLRQQMAAFARKLVGRSMLTNGWDFWCSLVPFGTYNAMYDPSNNELIILPAFLTAPVFDTEQSEASLYATAYVFGHEMCHGFDAGGSKHDENGAIRDWWAPEDKTAFEQKQEQLITLWGQLEHYPGQPADGRFTLTENMADYGGFTLAFEAYTRRLKSQGFSGKQYDDQLKKFFLSYGMPVAVEPRERDIELLKQSFTNDVHSAGHNRVNGIFRLSDEWYRIYNVKSTDKLYVAPSDRVRIW